MNPFDELDEQEVPFINPDEQEESFVEDAGQPDDPSEPPCRAPSTDHSRFRGFNRRSQAALPEPEPASATARPAWMQNTRLLPKRPPGKI